jgi:hypothetical protein
MDKYFDISKFFMKNEQMKDKIPSIPAAIYSKPIKINQEQQVNMAHDNSPKNNAKYMDDLYSEVFLDAYFKT